MDNISITKKRIESDKKMVFEVDIGEGVDKTTHKVTLTDSYWKELTKEEIEPRELIKRSFEFLLSKEPKEAILNEFDLTIIGKYFPEYKESIKDVE